MDIWRISNFADLSGRGGLVVEGRWHRRGVPVVYCADHPSTAMLEILVHVDPEDIPETYQLLRIACPDDAPTISIDDADFSDLTMTQDKGSRLLAAGTHLLIDVPSVVMPAARNFLINPRHPLADRLKIAESFRYPFDRRLKG